MNACSFTRSDALNVQTLARPPLPSIVVAGGRIIPQWDVIKLSVSNAQDSRVNKLLVEPGDHVQEDQVIAILQGAEQRLADLQAAQINLKLLQAQLVKAQQGDSKPGTLMVQQAVIARLEEQIPLVRNQKQAEINNAKAIFYEASLAYQRRQVLSQEGAIGQAEFDTVRRELESAQALLIAKKADAELAIAALQAQLNEEKAKLLELQQIRPIDITIAKAELEKALLEVEQRKADFEDTQVRVPISGQILRINTKVGEQVNTQLGIVDLGRTQQMFVQAEIYETDITKVSKGQRATIVSEYGGFQGEIHGVVEAIGLQIGKKNLSEGTANPTSDESARVVDVSIRVDSKDSSKVAGLTNMQVRVMINVSTGNT